MEIMSAYAGFHSSYMGVIREFSNKYNVDPRCLIIAVCEEDKINAPSAMVERIAKKINNQGDEIFTARFRLDQYYGAEQSETG